MSYIAISVVSTVAIIGLCWLLLRHFSEQQTRSNLMLTEIMRQNAEQNRQQVQMVAESVKQTIDVVTREVYGPANTILQPVDLESETQKAQAWWLDEEIAPDPLDAAVMDPFVLDEEPGGNGISAPNMSGESYE